jgi:mgtE-like transporter
MLRFPRRLAARFGAVIRADVAGFRAGFGALLISSGGDLVAGVTLASINHTLDLLPALFVLIPAAIGMRGNVFGALGSRLGTLIHTGDFSLTRRLRTPVGQNVAAALLLSISMSVVLAGLAKVVILGAAIPGALSVADLVVVSTLGGVLSSLVVLAVTVGVSWLSARRGWDLDNVAAPVVTATGDMVTLPALFLGTFLVRVPWVTPVVAAALAVAGLAAAAIALRSQLDLLRRIARESLPILVLAGIIDVVAGVTIEKRLEAFVAFPALLVLVPSFLEDSGALGSILAARLSTRLHLGTLRPRLEDAPKILDDVILVYLFSLSVFLLLGVSADVVAGAFGLASPGVLRVIEIALLAGLLATTFAVIVACAAAAATFRFGLDPDNHGVPLVTSSLDLLGAGSLILVLVALHLG